MEAMAKVKVNRLPEPTWNWLGMNESSLEGEDAGRLNTAEQRTPVKISLTQGETKESVFRFVCGDEENKAQQAELCAGDKSRLTVWMEISSSGKAKGLFRLITDIKAEKNARVRLVQVQLLGSDYRFVNDIKAECEEGAKVELLQIFLGGAKTWTGFCGNLNGAGGGVSADVGYWCRDAQRLDMNYVVLHKAKNTRSRILTKGVLADKAFKLFRGTIDFKRGASGSEGEETEEVLMLGEDAVNQTIPLILCGEEDVRGNHGATIGEPEEEVLFYMASRGIGKDEAAALLARTKIDGLRARIGRSDLEERVREYMEEAVENA